MDLIDRQTLLRKLFPYEVVDKKNCVINAYAVERAILDMPNKADSEEIQKAVDYLEKVKDNWTNWHCHHKKLIDAIEILLEAVKDD